MSQLIDALNWRYATKKFDPEAKLSEAEFDQLVDATRLAASSYGLQPYGFAIVRNPELRSQLKEASYGQPQVTDASHLLVFATRTDLNHGHVEAYLQRIAAQRNIPVNHLGGFGDTIKGTLDALGQEDATLWATKQLYIAVGFLLTTAAHMGIDACPMEGFESAKYDELLGLPEKGLSSRVVVPLGRRSEEDTLANAAKVRFAREEVFLEY